MHHKQLRKPIFLMCSERSGSNLVSRIFGAHPDYFAPSPSHLFRVFSTLEDGPGRAPDVLRLFDAKLGIWKLDALSDAEKRALLDGCETVPEMIASLLNHEGALRGKPHLFLKENSAYAFLPFMEQAADTPGYVHMIRDPRDMAASWVSAPNLRGGVVRSARRWLADAEGSQAAREAGRNIAALTYEALVSQPEENLRRVCAEIGIEFAPSMLEHVKAAEGVAQDADRTSMWKNISRGIMSDNFNKFRNKLSDDEIAYIEALCGAQMARFGYEKSRPEDAPEFGSHADFASLETALEAREPWEKPNYQELSAEERQRLEHWSALRDELVARYGTH